MTSHAAEYAIAPATGPAAGDAAGVPSDPAFRRGHNNAAAPNTSQAAYRAGVTIRSFSVRSRTRPRPRPYSTITPATINPSMPKAHMKTTAGNASAQDNPLRRVDALNSAAKPYPSTSAMGHADSWPVNMKSAAMAACVTKANRNRPATSATAAPSTNSGFAAMFTKPTYFSSYRPIISHVKMRRKNADSIRDAMNRLSARAAVLCSRLAGARDSAGTRRLCEAITA